MALRKSAEDGVKGSQDQDDGDYQHPSTDEDNEGQTAPLPRTTQVRETEDDKGDVSEGDGGVALEDNTSEVQHQTASSTAQVRINDTPSRCYILI